MEILTGVHHFDTGPFNWYLIEEHGRLTLIDAGFPGHYSIFREGLKEIGRSPEDLEAVLLTHSHADHTGFASRIEAEFQVPVFVHNDDRDAICRPLELPWFGLLSNAWRPYVRSMLLHATWNGIFRCPRVRKPNSFADGDQLDFPGRPQVIHVPGHTPGEVAFFLPNHRVLVSGDTIVTRNLMSGQDGPPQIPHELLNHRHEQAAHSLDRLKELGRLTILPGHGKPWEGEMEEAIDLARRSV